MDLAAPRCPVLLGMVCAPVWLPNYYLQIYDEAGTEWRVSFYCKSDSNFMPVKSCIFNVFLFIFQAIQFYMIQYFQWNDVGEAVSLFMAGGFWSLSGSH